jgi:hypothetical protein
MVMPCSRSASRPSVSRTGRPGAGRAALQHVELVGQDGLAVEQQAADQRALAVVHRAGGEKSERLHDQK